MPTKTQSFGNVMAPLKTSEKASDKTSVGDEPTITEAQWRAFSIASAILTGVFVAGAFAWIFADGFDGATDPQLAQTLSPFGVAFFAIVTFCTACWRGSINVRQADQAERELRAKLLQEGAKLMGEDDKPSQIGAGIASLEILVTGNDENMAVQAMNLLVDYIQRSGDVTSEDRLTVAASAALRNGVRLNRFSERNIKFTDTTNESVQKAWQIVPGVNFARYFNGTFLGLGDDYFIAPEKSHFLACSIRGVGRPLHVNLHFSDCVFDTCSIGSFKLYEHCGTHHFSNCDFSGCIFDSVSELQMAAGDGNFFYSDEPPIFSNGSSFSWTGWLQERPAEERPHRQAEVLAAQGWAQLRPLARKVLPL